MRHHLGHIKNIPTIIEGISLRYHLDFKLPLCCFTLLEMVEQISSCVVVVTEQIMSFLIR